MRMPLASIILSKQGFLRQPVMRFDSQQALCLCGFGITTRDSTIVLYLLLLDFCCEGIRPISEEKT